MWRNFKSDLVFGIGPAGTGKTFLSIACAVQLYEEKKIERIILTRPAVEAGESLRISSGDLVQKIDPYLKPLYDSLYYFLSFDRVNKLIEKNIIEIVPLAYMRGRTLENAFIILDEAQNSTKAQMKMFLTRIGKGSKVVITGDPTQTDLPSNIESGLSNVEFLFSKINGIEFVKFKSQDVVRHRLVKEIIKHTKKMKSDISVTYLTGRKNNPSPVSFKKWINLAISTSHLIHVKIVNNTESKKINSKFRGIDKSTNVLSFSYQNSKNFVWGDLLLCSDVIISEANSHKKDIRDHYAHLTLHGSLI